MLSRHDGFDSRVHMQLFEDLSQVVAYRLGGERELLRDLGRREAGRDQLEDLRTPTIASPRRRGKCWARTPRMVPLASVKTVSKSVGSPVSTA